MHAFHVRRLNDPSATFDESVDIGPLSVQQIERVVDLDALRRVIRERMNGQHQNKPRLVVRHLSCTLKTRFQQRIAFNAAVRVSTVRRVEHKTSDSAVPVGRQDVTEARCIPTHDSGVVRRFPSVRPSKVRLCALHHFRMNVDAHRLTAAQRGLDEKSTRPRHRIDHGTAVQRSGGEVHGEACQGWIKADGLEEGALTGLPLAV